MLFGSIWTGLFTTLFVIALLLVVGLLVMVIKCWRKVQQGTALIVTGGNRPTVHFSKAIVWPLIRQTEIMDISVKRIEIFRHGSEGLICKDNVRADIKVAFFVRVNNTEEDVLKVAQSIGVKRASQQSALVELFDAKFSEALKTVGKQFNFVDLYTERDTFKDRILQTIGRDLNGYILDDCAIDYLEQTPMEKLDPQNILDSEGIKKITDLTARQQVLANHISREKEKTITKQNVEAREAILELERQQAEAEQKQKREIAAVVAREEAEAARIEQEERLRAEQARIRVEEELAVAEQNKLRQILVAQRNKERTDKVEIERVERDRLLEVTERDRVVSLAEIEKEKAIEVEKKAIQDVIRERVMVERAVVEEEEKIKDTREFAGAERAKRVAVTEAEQEAEQRLVKEIKAAEAARDAARFAAEREVIAAEARRNAAERDTAAKKMLAEGITAEEAALGIAEANVIEKKAVAEARGMEAKAEAVEKQGSAEANVMRQKFHAEAEGISEKAKAMKLFHEAGQEHEEFKLRLDKDKEVELAAIGAHRDIAHKQAEIVSKALESARIDIVGGETEFFDRITHAITSGKAVDRWVGNSDVLRDIKGTFFNGDPVYFRQRLEQFVSQFNLGSEDIKNLSIAALIGKMMGLTDEESVRNELQRFLDMARAAGWSDRPAAALKPK
ncbi:MAG TPA: flotillin family protein [Planctomycetes bacterium]|nr:flotillin family protein [Planctomycetota bacterium]